MIPDIAGYGKCLIDVVQLWNYISTMTLNLGEFSSGFMKSEITLVSIMEYIVRYLISSLFVYICSAVSVRPYGGLNSSAPLGVTKNGTCKFPLPV